MMNNLVNLATSGLSQFSALTSKATSLVANVKTAINSLKGIKNLASSFMAGGSGNGLTESFAGNLTKSADRPKDGIYEFLSNFKNGVMKSNRFRAEFNLPSGVGSGNGSHAVNKKAMSGAMKSADVGFNGTSSINIKCHTATFPQRMISTVDFRCNSVQFKVPYTASYDGVSLSFYADGNMDTREYFELWQSAIINFGNNTANFYKEYVSDIKLYIQNDAGDDTYGVILYECYPMQISMFDMGYGMGNTPLNIQILFSFKSWLPLSNSNSSDYNRTF